MEKKQPEYVSCDIWGNLGEQLFQISATLNYAWKYGKIPIFQKKNQEYYYWNTLFSEKLNVIDIDEFEKINFTNIISSNDNFQELPFMHGNVMLNGIFQSYKYFSKRTLNKMIELIYSNEDYMYKAYDNYNEIKKYFGYIGDNDMVSMCIMRNNRSYIELINYRLDETYYHKAYEYCCNKANKKLNIVIFTDDVSWCSNNLKFDNVFYVTIPNLCINFILLSFFQHNIISNSLFGLYATYISSFEDKIIVCPKRWLNSCGTEQNNNDIYYKKTTIL